MELVIAFQTYFGNSYTEWNSVAQKFCYKLRFLCKRSLNFYCAVDVRRRGQSSLQHWWSSAPPTTTCCYSSPHTFMYGIFIVLCYLHTCLIHTCNCNWLRAEMLFRKVVKFKILYCFSMCSLNRT